MKLVFFGSPDFAIPTLNALYESSHDVLGVVTSPDKKSGRGLKIQSSSVKQKAEKFGLPIFQPVALNSDEFKSTIENMLDKPKLREEANNYLSPKLNDFKWSNRVLKWFDGWKHLDDLKVMSDTDSYKKMVDYIHKMKSVSKKELLEHMGWGVRISFSDYRID